MALSRLLLRRARVLLRAMHPSRVVLGGYLSYVAAGWLLLCLPWASVAAVPALDNLFTAVSAMSTTGLATVSVGTRYTLFGQIVVLALIQLGGVGYMTLGSFLVLSRRPDLTAVRSGVARTVFSLPASFEAAPFLRSVIRFTLAIELAGAVALYFILRDAGVAQPAWSAVFHSVSSFCTAGFSLFDTSFEGFALDVRLNAVVAVLSYLGAIGFIVCVDLWRRLRGEVRRSTLTSRIILVATLALTVLGTAALYLDEPSIRHLARGERLLASFFQCMTALTTVGFNTIPIGTLSNASLVVLLVLMVIGASPSGTGGGVKSTSISAVLGVMWSAVRGSQEVRFWGKAVPVERVWMAFATLGLYLAALAAGVYLLELTESTPFERNVFEAASALGTVGLSTGITVGLTAAGKVIVIALMLVGRVGPLTFGASLFYGRTRERPAAVEDLAI